MRIQQIADFLNDVHEGICEGDDVATMQLQSTELYRMIRLLVDGGREGKLALRTYDGVEYRTQQVQTTILSRCQFATSERVPYRLWVSDGMRTMPKEFKYDVFLSHNQADKLKVRRLAERLRAEGLRVWFDEWVIEPGDDVYLAVERGLAVARVQVLCLSPAALGSDWVTLERSTVLFRDPTNSGRRFIPLLLADCELPDTLRRYKYVDFRQDEEAAFKKLLTACRVPAKGTLGTARPRLIEKLFRRGLFRMSPAESLKMLLGRKPAKPVVLEQKLEVDVQAIENKVIEIISEQMGVDKSEITRDKSFIKDLNADSLDTVELVMEFEDEFDMSIPDEEAEKIGTVGDAVDYIVNIAQTKKKEST